MFRSAPQVVSIASGATLSEAFPLNGIAAMIGIPLINSVTLGMKWSIDQTSANFFPVRQVAPNSGNLVMHVQPGSVAVPLPMDMMTGGYAKIEASAALTNPATFVIAVRW